MRNTVTGGEDKPEIHWKEDDDDTVREKTF